MIKAQTFLPVLVLCAALIMIIWSILFAQAASDTAVSPSLSEVVLFGMPPAKELTPEKYREDLRPCVESYLKVVSSSTYLHSYTRPEGPEKALKARKHNLEEQIVIIIGQKTHKAAKTFAHAVPLCLEWEGMSEAPLAEADAAGLWLDQHPDTPISPFLHLFMAHRLRAGFEASCREKAKELSAILAQRYREQIKIAKSSSNKLISCIAEDLDAQPYVYLQGSGRP